MKRQALNEAASSYKPNGSIDNSEHRQKTWPVWPRQRLECAISPIFLACITSVHNACARMKMKCAFLRPTAVRPRGTRKKLPPLEDTAWCISRDTPSKARLQTNSTPHRNRAAKLPLDDEWRMRFSSLRSDPNLGHLWAWKNHSYRTIRQNLCTVLYSTVI